MKCPHCSTVVRVEWWIAGVEKLEQTDSDIEDYGFGINGASCPQCEGPLVKLQWGKVEYSEYGGSIVTVEEEKRIHPLGQSRPLEPEVPEPYRGEFEEACAIQNISPKASAALSRRILQNVLRGEYDIDEGGLSSELKAFVENADVPTFVAEAVDAVRKVGNFAAHPSKDTNTGKIVDVEPGEAEWLLDVLESLFDFTFVQPKRLENKRQKLNDKLQSIGRPPMKTPDDE
jgi:Zn ribbon nucleic-acid-binding protein